MSNLPINLPASIQQSSFRALDGLRGVSIAIVIIAHALTPFLGNSYFGLTGVYVFFVISGFLITTLLLKEKAKYGSISLKGFYIRRCLRILPVAYLFLVVLLCLNYLFKLAIPGSSFLTCFLFTKNLPILENHDWYTGHFWSLGVEEQFYLLFPFLLVSLSLRNYKRLITVLIIIIPILSYIHTKSPDSGSISWVVALFGGGTVLILIGSLFSILLLTQNRFITTISDKAPAVSSLLLFIIGSILLYPTLPTPARIFSVPIFGIIVAFVIILNLKERSTFSRLLEVEWMKKLGILSYSLYIWQQLFTYKQPWHHAGTNVWLLLLNLAALFAVSFLSYSLYEKKFLGYKKRFKRI
jgi:peptidoglycan/LPS O-acetylase OafA/YrhL